MARYVLPPWSRQLSREELGDGGRVLPERHRVLREARGASAVQLE